MSSSILDPDTRLVWLDIETMGLDAKSDPIIEIGVAITDLEHNILDSFSTPVWDKIGIYNRALADLRQRAGEGDTNASFVYEMHDASGLWYLARQRGMTPTGAETAVGRWLQERGVHSGKDPMCGSSIGFDREFLRAQMPSIDSRFSYRIIDVSSIKESCRRYNPVMYSHMEEDAYTHPKKEHRVLADIEDSISEYRWYVENFFFVSI